MKFATTAILAIGAVGRGVYGAAATVVPRQGSPAPTKIEILEALHFKDLGAKRARMTYGPYTVPSAEDEETNGMLSFRDFNTMLPCKDCLILGWVPDLKFDNGKSANANNKIWLHHIGLSNLNRTDQACLNWPERIMVNGNERSPFDLTSKGTRKAGYYVRETDQFHMATEVMNMDHHEKVVNLVMEWEYIPGSPADFEIAFPIWLDVKGPCLNETGGVGADAKVFTAKGKSGWKARHSGDLILGVSHIHDGNTKQDIFLDGKLVCSSVPAYGETAEFVTHNEGDGHDHDHGGDEHTYHVSSITQCNNFAKVVPGSHLTITSDYDMVTYPGQVDHHGGEEPIMCIQFLYLARPRDEAMKDILASKGGDLQSFSDQVRANQGKDLIRTP